MFLELVAKRVNEVRRSTLDGCYSINVKLFGRDLGGTAPGLYGDVGLPGARGRSGGESKETKRKQID